MPAPSLRPHRPDVLPVPAGGAGAGLRPDHSVLPVPATGGLAALLTAEREVSR